MEELLTASQVAEILGCSRASVFAWASDGTLPSVRVGDRLVRFQPSVIQEWLEDRRRDRETSSVA
jgi:excisionase family DNA binding protein